MNAIPGVVCSVIKDELFVYIDIKHNEDRFGSCVLHSDKEAPYCTSGAPVHMIFKEADTIVALHNDAIISCRNRFPSKVHSVTYGKIMTRISARYRGYPIVSLVTTESARRMDLQVDNKIVCIVKSTSMMLGSREQET
jgi:molybdopterin-binding protein